MYDHIERDQNEHYHTKSCPSCTQKHSDASFSMEAADKHVTRLATPVRIATKMDQNASSKTEPATNCILILHTEGVKMYLRVWKLYQN